MTPGAGRRSRAAAAPPAPRAPGLARVETAASLLGIPLQEARRYLSHARRSIDDGTEDEIVAATVELMRRDQRQSAINQARRSIGQIP